MEGQAPVTKSDTIKNVQIRELKNHLPVETKGKIDQSFTFIDWGMNEEKQIAKIKEKNPSMGKFISAVLALMLNTLNGEDFKNKKDGEKKLIINQMPMANVLYMYVYLRYDQLGEEVKMAFPCPFCGHTNKDFNADLNDIDVDCKCGAYEDVVEYKLKKPITLEKGQQLVDTLKIGIAKWDVMEKADSQEANDEASMKEHTFRCSIVGVNGDVKVLPDEIIRKLKKIDIERIHKIISTHNAGATIQAEIKCPKCKASYTRQVDWGYENFFGLGSLPSN